MCRNEVDLSLTSAIVNDFRSWNKYFVEHPPIELFTDFDEKIAMERFISADLKKCMDVPYNKLFPILKNARLHVRTSQLLSFHFSECLESYYDMYLFFQIVLHL